MARNERLRQLMQTQGITCERLAELVEVDPKTAYRWRDDGRLPHPGTRMAVARMLGTEVEYLWPEAGMGVTRLHRQAPGVVATYLTRADVPSALWPAMVRGANSHIRTLVYAGLFWVDANPGMVATLAARADAGVKVQLLYGDPDSRAITARGEEEDSEMAARVRMALRHIRPLVGHPNVEIRLHDTPLYTSMYIVDDTGLFNLHVYGAPAASSPVLEVRRHPDSGCFEHYAEAFEKVWATARPIT